MTQHSSVEKVPQDFHSIMQSTYYSDDSLDNKILYAELFD